MRPKPIPIVVSVLMTLTGTACTQPDMSPSPGPIIASPPAWVHQLGSDATDAARGVAVDDHGEVYVVGETEGNLDDLNRGESDAFVARYTPDGRLVWVRQFGTPARDAAAAVTIDHAGNVYVTGLTFGSLGGPLGGAYDAFVARYDPAGSQVWLTQIGTAERDLAGAVTTDAGGNVYVAGDTFGDLGGPNAGVADAYLAKLAANGQRLWTRQLGTSMGDVINGITANRAGDLYVAGQTDGDLGGAAGSSDAFIARYDTDGHRQWVRQFGTAATDYANAIAADPGGAVYIAGLTDGDLRQPNAGNTDAFIATFDPTGSPLWSAQLGTAGSEEASSIALDTDGAAYVAGYTDGHLAAPSAGAGDAYVAKVTHDGRTVWTRQLGSIGNDTAKGICVDGAKIYVAGLTSGGLDGSTNRGFDAFLAKYVA